MKTANLSTIIDAYGQISAEIAELEGKKKALREALINAIGDGAAEGELFRITISTSDRETLDMAAVRAHLSHQFIAAHTKVTPTTVVKASARNGIKLVA